MEEGKEVTLSPFNILLIIVIEGFVTIAVEMLTIRQLITVVGSSVIITSLIIGVFLLFLALGYYKGGQYKKNYQRILRINFIWSSILLGLGLSYPFVQIFFNFLFTQLTANSLFAATIYLLVITAPLVYFLGQTVPITTNLFRYEHHVGSISGKVLALSTIGSFLGSIISTLVLMNYLGVAWTIFLNYALILVLILLLCRLPAELFYIMLIIISALFVYFLNIELERRLFVTTNNYGDYRIIANTYFPPSNNIGNMLVINNAPSSFVTMDRKGFPYIETIKQILFQDLKLRNSTILVLGAGGFSLSAESNYTNRIVYVDVDGSLPNTVHKGMIDKINGQFIVDDARKYLMHTTQKYDAVVLDAFSSKDNIPFHLLTKEGFMSMKKVLRPNGVAIFNIIANPTLRNNYSKRVDNTIRSVFSDCMSIAQPYGNNLANIIYVCHAQNNSDTTVYTDDKNASMIDIYQNK